MSGQVGTQIALLQHLYCDAHLMVARDRITRVIGSRARSRTALPDLRTPGRVAGRSHRLARVTHQLLGATAERKKRLWALSAGVDRLKSEQREKTERKGERS